MKHLHDDIYTSNSDVLLLSSDNVKFSVHRCILAAASPFFQDMFALPQPPARPVNEEWRPVIPVAEPASTMHALLRFVYPVPHSIISSLDELVTILGAAVKYDFLGAISSLRKQLISPAFLSDDPARVFAIASRYDFEDEAQVASQHTLSIAILDSPLSDDLRFITAHSYHRLLVLHKKRSENAQALLKIPEDVKCLQCAGPYYGAFVPPKWWKEFERMAREELAVRPTTDIIFGMTFLGRAAKASGCGRCAESILECHEFLLDLKRQIDDLPSTI
ncbi:hypothetical protein K503DRAFT_850657 [Rhizopogon vinicolor AM-OR11-026]|uniref:BTB domain-containing protein n=1 Tax=Rhizopogon vinicolor AM-OR11-026 TaxID=1314800 RepID=A0A1B7MWG0_9AGAM|nr:hypothetical protein K503DRAFT_850657 [Rhizopogon vinicolor AM-OR11-026]